QLEGRDGHVAFYELEERLDQFEVELLVATEGGLTGVEPTATPGRRTFDPLLILTGNRKDPDTGTKLALPYVCVRTADGDRWFASIRTEGPGTREEPGGIYRHK